MLSLNGKVALVTGSGHGIGAEIARQLAAQGASVVVNYRSAKDDAEALAAEIAGDGGQAVAVQADVAKRADVAALFEAADRAFGGRLDILVNNAAVGGSTTLLEDVTEAEIDRVYATNVKGVIFSAQEAVRRMGAGGRIVNISSTTAVYTGPKMTIYGSSKGTAKTLADIWARELGRKGITVNTVTPGATSPGMMDRLPKEVWDAVSKASPLGGIGKAADVAAAVVFLCSDEARWLTGQHIIVNGGAGC